MFKYRIFLILAFLSSFSNFYSQIRIKELPPYDFNSVAADFLNLTNSRQIIPLNSGWIAYTPDMRQQSVNVNLPCAFKEATDLIFEKEFTISDNILSSKDLVLHLLGVNYSAEILLNDVVVFKNDIANIPVSVLLTRELLKSSEANNLKLNIQHELDDKNTIPPLQRFLFPENYGGITRDAFIEVLPLDRVTINKSTTKISDNYTQAYIDLACNIEQRPADNDSNNERNFDLDIKLKNPEATVVWQKNISDISGTQKSLNIEINFSNPDLWSPSSPEEYSLELSLRENGRELDRVQKELVFKEIKSGNDLFILNGVEFEVKGITYIPNSQFRTNKNIYDILDKDLKTIKRLGFNSVRFAKHIPHPYALKKCTDLGLFAFVEIPIHSMPESFADDESYRYRSINLLNSFIEEYANFPSVLAIGVGTSYISDSESHAGFISNLARRIKSKTEIYSYASFIGDKFTKIPELDLYGIEIFDRDPYESMKDLNSIKESISQKHIFVSEATFPNYYGSKSGYQYKFSIEAQAKYYEDVINFSEGNKLSGFFINTFKNYIGDYTSMYTRYNENNNYSIGLNDDSDNTNRIPYKVISSKLRNSERVTIPIGSSHDDSPIFIIVTGLVLAILMAILINSKKKFREDATRALLRPYNFYSDIRDQRILSGFHTIALMFILAGSHALLLTNLFFYFKSNILFEKILLSFGSNRIMESVSYLAWHPLQAFIYSYVFSIVLFFVIALMIKAASFFIKNRVHFLNVYFVVIWAFLPMAILLPLKLILYRILIADIMNLYLYGFLVVYLIWIVQRIIKGVYVIFDTSRTAVYFYSSLLLLVIFGSVLLVFQLTDSSILYIITAIRQFQLI